MRFLPHEHADITDALKKYGIDPGTMLFVKRRGRLHVGIPGRNDAFAFFREKSTKLDDHGRWQERVDYFIGMKKEEPLRWPEVMARFLRWLNAG